MRRALAAWALVAVALAGTAEARGRHYGAVRAPHANGGRGRASMGEIKPVKALGPAEFRPYQAAKPLKPFSYLDHERRGRKAR